MDTDKLQLASDDDFKSIDFEHKISNSKTVSLHDICAQFRQAMSEAEALGESVAYRVYRVLFEVTSYYFNPDDKAEPYSPMMQMDGKRSAIPSDFSREQSRVLASIGSQVKHSAVRARLSDVGWLADRRNHLAATTAIEAFVDTVEEMMAGRLAPEAEEPTFRWHDARRFLARALVIGRASGWDKPAVARAKAVLASLRADAFRVGDQGAFAGYAALDLAQGVSDTAQIATEAEAMAASTEGSPYQTAEFWMMAARAHQRSRNEEAAARCQIAASEAHVRFAEASPGSALMATHHLTHAIELLRGVPKRLRPPGRVEALGASLVRRQADIRDEMATVTRPIDLGDIVEQTIAAFKDASLSQCLARFATLDNVIARVDLEKQALEQARQSPFASIFAGSQHDREGKVVARTGSSDFAAAPEGDALKSEISRRLGLDRHIIVPGCIEPARMFIHNTHSIAANDLAPILFHSPFVPEDRRHTFSVGFQRMFAGDYMSAAYFLIPQIENSIRYLLKQAGQDVSIINANQTQEDIGLSALLGRLRPQLENVVGQDIAFYLEMLFDFRGGPNLRNTITHGLMDDDQFWSIDTRYGCWFVYFLTCACLLPHWNEVFRDE
ncbi:DUF4209 domain-containing protein [Methylobacterium sp. J-048]|uniref:DUF4209 domain-containing protein n=1 Tax=Methylobacterium sp. J-048 TaxID=2836635 RepID=UPI001FB97AC5|nr:DUF4209 domain-containing protein [Methylobacterium sp. J-048]MCJ2059816.1 DUF4209 domain-containing protein [Methylobacterium sp. J-048]